MSVTMSGGFKLPQGAIKINKPPRYATFGGKKDTIFSTSEDDLTVTHNGNQANGTWIETDLNFNNGVTKYYWEVETYAAPSDDRGLVVGITGRNPTYDNQNGNSAWPEFAASMRHNVNGQIYHNSSGNVWQNSGEGSQWLYWNDTVPTRLMFAFDSITGRFYTGANGTWLKGATSATIAAGATTGGIGVQNYTSGITTSNWQWRPLLGNNNISADTKTWQATGHFNPKFWTYEAPAGFEPFKEA